MFLSAGESLRVLRSGAQTVTVKLVRINDWIVHFQITDPNDISIEVPNWTFDPSAAPPRLGEQEASSDMTLLSHFPASSSPLELFFQVDGNDLGEFDVMTLYLPVWSKTTSAMHFNEFFQDPQRIGVTFEGNMENTQIFHDIPGTEPRSIEIAAMVDED